MQCRISYVPRCFNLPQQKGYGLNKFNARQTLVDFGPKPLDEVDRITSSRDSKIDAVVKTGRPVYRRVSPHYCAGFDRGFYFQPVLIECDLGSYNNKLTDEPSVISLPGIQGTKSLKRLDETCYELPFVPCYILLNRSIFPPRRHREDEDIWLGVMTERTRAIAHELLYAEQYADHYDVDQDLMTQVVALPTTSDENALMCPTELIEKTLHSVEGLFGIQFLTAGSFIDGETRILDQYYRIWSQTHAVSKNVCESRTCSYLQMGLRDHVHQRSDDYCSRIAGIINQPQPNSADFTACLKPEHPHFPQIDALLGEIARQFPLTNKKTLIYILSHHLDKKNGASHH